MGKSLEQALNKGRFINGQQVYKKVLNIIGHQRNPNQNCNKCHFTPTKTVRTKKTNNTKFWLGHGETRTLLHK